MRAAQRAPGTGRTAVPASTAQSPAASSDTSLVSGPRHVLATAGRMEGHSAVNGGGSAAEEPTRPHGLSCPDPQLDMREERRISRRQTGGQADGRRESGEEGGAREMPLVWTASEIMRE